MDTCGKCGREWHSVCDGKKVLPVRVPISTDGASLMVVCENCADSLHLYEIGEIALAKYIASSKTMADSPSQASEASMVIDAWVTRASLEAFNPT